ncbi:SDR family NAD(P)-dependent oxidoreductase [Streptomyces sp. NPDC057690]|uniref:SDR family NAD(P)-dependent oxidoreductase n=1 Tax=Streptomyces sp. NPDC057690 TaxID=3346214 RepID=UPI00367B3300
MSDFQGLGALVTGGCSGIGAATATLLRAAGAQVTVLDVSTDHAPDDVLAIRCDITDPEAVSRAVSTAAEGMGRLDILVNNAGIGAVGDIGQNADEEWARVFDVNVTGIARVTRAALPYLRRSPHAAVVNLCSAVAFIGVRQRALYSASKGAVHALTLAMAADHAADGIRVTAVAPGTVDTPWVGRLLDGAEDPARTAEALRKRQPLGRLVSADEVARAVVGLAAPGAGATTGTVLHVDGGMVALRL